MARHIPFRVIGQCIDCGGEIEGYRHVGTLRCEDCYESMKLLQTQALVAVKNAISAGDLRPATELQCTDCESTAQEYDHRDYRKPLDVAAVCRKCNQRRGPASWREATAAA